MQAEHLDIAEEIIDRDAPGDGAERQQMAAEPQRRQAEYRRRAAGQQQGEDEAEPGRAAVKRAVPGGGVGADTDEGGLAERGEPADAGQEDEAERDQRIDPGVVHQGHAEGAEQQRQHREDCDDRQDEEEPMRHQESICSSSSSLPWPKTIERQTRTGISVEKTTISLSALSQKAA